jgi:hypothetical protein
MLAASGAGGAAAEESNRVELEHLIGFTGHFPSTYLAHPTKASKTVAR